MQLPLQSRGSIRISTTSSVTAQQRLLPQQLGFRVVRPPVKPYKCVGDTCYCHSAGDCDDMILDGVCIDHDCQPG